MMNSSPPNFRIVSFSEQRENRFHWASLNLSGGTTFQFQSSPDHTDSVAMIVSLVLVRALAVCDHAEHSNSTVDGSFATTKGRPRGYSLRNCCDEVLRITGSQEIEIVQVSFSFGRESCNFLVCRGKCAAIK